MECLFLSMLTPKPFTVCIVVGWVPLILYLFGQNMRIQRNVTFKEICLNSYDKIYPVIYLVAVSNHEFVSAFVLCVLPWKWIFRWAKYLNSKFIKLGCSLLAWSHRTSKTSKLQGETRAAHFKYFCSFVYMWRVINNQLDKILSKPTNQRSEFTKVTNYRQGK